MTELGHERFEGSAAAYALGALEDQEARAFEEHLAGCERCRDELATMRETVGSIALVVPAATPSAQLKQRLMAEVRRQSPRRPAGRPRASGWVRPGLAIGSMVAAAAVVLVVVLTSGGGASGRTFAGIVHARGATVSIRESNGGAQLRVSRLPAPRAHRIYQVWLKRAAAAPIPTHTLFATSTGSVTLPGDLSGVRAVLVTAEPRPSGSLAPTRAPIIVVPLA
jgi:anti-sigma factor RsiW